MMSRIFKSLPVVLALLAILTSASPITQASTTYTLEGDVREMEVGNILRPRQGITVELTRLGTGERWSTSTDSDGYFCFKDLAVGSYRLEFKEEGYENIPYPFELKEGGVGEIHALIFDHLIGVGAGVRGSLRHLADNARVELHGTPLGTNVDFKLETRTKSVVDLSWFGFELVPRGTYTLTIEHQDFERWSTQIKIDNHEEYSLAQINLSKPGPPTGNLALVAAAVIGFAVVVALAVYLRARRHAEVPPVPPPSEPQKFEESPT